MPLIPSNFAANSLSGTVRVSSGYANVVLTVSKYAFEDRTKTFTLKLRRDSTAGPVIAQSNLVTLTDFSEIVSLTANTSTVAEGNLVSFTLVTANVVDGANVFFSVLPVTANITTSDFFGANTGRVTINSNQGIFALYANADYSLVDETNETFKVQIRTVEPTGNVVFVSSNVAITDFFKRINVFRFEESASAVTEGSSVTFTVYAHNVTSGSLLYYYTSGNADISGSNTGSVAMNGVSNTITLTTASTVPGNQTRSFNLVLSGSNLGAPIATSNTISVADLALTSITATGGSESLIGGYKIHRFTTSGNLIITGASPLTQMEYLAIAGGGGGGSAAGRSEQFGYGGAGGGAGGVLIGNLSAATVGNITIVVGAGGGGGTANPNFYGNAGSLGGNTVLGFNLVAVGGGGGGGGLTATNLAGGSGGGGSKFQIEGANVIGQGNPGGLHVGFGTRSGAGGGGGYSSQGGSAFFWPVGQDNAGYAGIGGNGLTSSISGANVQYAGGGGGGYTQPNTFQANVGVFGGGNGAPGSPTAGGAGNVNTGGGGGGGAGFFSPVGIQGLGGAGGSGVVIIRYPWQPLPFYSSVTANVSAVTAGGNVFYVVNTAFANGSVLFYDTLGNITSSSFVGGNTGSFTVTSNATVLRLQTVGNIPAGETRNFALRIREDSVSGNIVLVSSNVTVYDSNTSIYINATGGNVSTISGYRVHVFESSNNFTISSLGLSAYNNIEYLVVAGGGGGGSGDNGDGGGAGGGAGGFLTNTTTLSVATYTITVGAGGGGGGYNAGQSGTNGSNSEIISSSPLYGANILAIGGGGGGHQLANGLIGGSGGGEGGRLNSAGALGTLGQGNPGGAGAAGKPPGGAGQEGGGGGGGASQAGAQGNNPSPTINEGGKGGDGRPSLITGANVIYAGGGGGGAGRGLEPTGSPPNGAGGAGGGGAGGIGNNGTVNLGGGGGGAMARVAPAGPAVGGSGGSGVVIIRYPFA